MAGRRAALIAAMMFSAAALSAPKIDKIVVSPNPAQFAGDKAPEVQVAVSVSRTKFDKGGCDARVDFGDAIRVEKLNTKALDFLETTPTAPAAGGRGRGRGGGGLR